MNLERFKDQDECLEMMMMYRAVFGSSQGKKVLADVMQILYWQNDNLIPDEPDVVGKRNGACEIANMLGCINDPYMTMEGLIEGLLNTPQINPNMQGENNET